MDVGQASGEKQETVEELGESSRTTGAPSPSDVESVNRPAVSRAADVLPVRDINLKRDFIGRGRIINGQWKMKVEAIDIDPPLRENQDKRDGISKK